MKIKNLKIALEQFDDEDSILINNTSKNDQMYNFVDIANIYEIKTPDGEKYIIIDKYVAENVYNNYN